MIRYILIPGLLLFALVIVLALKRYVNYVYTTLGDAQMKIKGVMLHLVFEAEKLYQSGTGRFKQAYVINLILNSEFYKGLPFMVQKLITYNVLANLVDAIVGDVFNAIKESNKAVQERLSS